MNASRICLGAVVTFGTGVVVAKIIERLQYKEKMKTTTKLQVIGLSGKRYSGKAETAQKLAKLFQEKNLKCHILNYSTSLKTEFCAKHNLYLNQLLSESKYLENHRDAMNEHCDAMKSERGEDYYDRLLHSKIQEIETLISENLLKLDVLIIGDVQTEKEAAYLTDTYGAKMVRVESTTFERTKRGWVMSAVDYLDREMEKYSYDYVIYSDKDHSAIMTALEKNQ